MQLRFAKPLRPIRNQSAMSGTRYRIFRNPLSGRKETRDEIAVFTGRRDDERETVNFLERFHIGSQGPYFRFRCVSDEVITRGKHFDRITTESRDERWIG